MNRFPYLLLLMAGLVLAGCSSTRSSHESGAPTTAASAGPPDSADGKAVATGNGDDLDMYADVLVVADPLEPLNRATFWLNHQLYAYALRPISKGYEYVVPEKGREAIYNAFENVKFPARFVNSLMQGNVYRAGQETGKFLLNSTFGIGGLGRPAQHVPFLADVPTVDMGQTFAKWGLGNGFYFILPVLGPTTLRDGVGRAGDYALDPITWAGFIWGGYAWFIAVPATNTMRSVPPQMAVYDAAIEDSIDPYLALRTGYLQYREEINSRAYDESGE